MNRNRRLALLLVATPAVAAVLALSSPGCTKGDSGGGGGSSPVTLTTDDDKILYAIGLSVGRNLTVFHLTDKELGLVKAGLNDMVSGKKPQVELETWGPKIQTLVTSRRNAAAEGEKAKSKEFLAKAAAEPGATQTPSGLVYKQLKPGSGEAPGPTDRVKVHYHGTLTDGTVFDSSVQRGQPAEFGLNMVVPCWTEGLQKMKVGEKSRLVCPSSIAYGDQGRPPTIPGGATLIFEVELLSIEKGPPGPPPGAAGMTGPPPGMGGPPGAGGGPPPVMGGPGGQRLQLQMPSGSPRPNMPPGHP